jgi:hypothetical protein
VSRALRETSLLLGLSYITINLQFNLPIRRLIVLQSKPTTPKTGYNPRFCQRLIGLIVGKYGGSSCNRHVIESNSTPKEMLLQHGAIINNALALRFTLYALRAAVTARVLLFMFALQVKVVEKGS